MFPLQHDVPTAKGSQADKNTGYNLLPGVRTESDRTVGWVISLVLSKVVVSGILGITTVLSLESKGLGERGELLNLSNAS